MNTVTKFCACLITGPETEAEADQDEAEGPGLGDSGEHAPRPDQDALRGYKEGIIDLLCPGESVFEALRRLGGLHVSLPYPLLCQIPCS